MTEPLETPMPTPVKVSAEQQEIIDHLKSLQENSRGARGGAKSDKEFCRDLGVSNSAWSMIKSGIYPSKVKTQESWDKLMNGLAIDLSKLQRKAALQARTAPKRMVELAPFEAVFKAVSECQAKPLNNSDRFILFLAPTGGGKSCLSSELSARFGALVVQARKSWKGYFNATKDIAMALSPKAKDLYNINDLENLILEETARKNYILVIDEGEYFNGDVLDLFKLILNSTRTVIVCCAIPVAYETWVKRFPHQSSQIKRRLHDIYQIKEITPDVVAKFLEPLKFDCDAKACAVALAKAANAFGHFDLITRIVEKMSEVDGIQFDAFTKKIVTEHASMGEGIK